MSGGARSRRKGYRTEARIRAIALAAGLECRRVPLSGAAPGWGDDLVIGSRSFEVKARAQGFRRLYRWLGTRHFGVIVVADREEPLLVVRVADFFEHCVLLESPEEGRPKSSRAVSGPPAAAENG